jgi:hypothetical protein
MLGDGPAGCCESDDNVQPTAWFCLQAATSGVLFAWPCLIVSPMFMLQIPAFSTPITFRRSSGSCKSFASFSSLITSCVWGAWAASSGAPWPPVALGAAGCVSDDCSRREVQLTTPSWRQATLSAVREIPRCIAATTCEWWLCCLILWMSRRTGRGAGMMQSCFEPERVKELNHLDLGCTSTVWTDIWSVRCARVIPRGTGVKK